MHAGYNITRRKPVSSLVNKIFSKPLSLYFHCCAACGVISAHLFGLLNLDIAGHWDNNAWRCLVLEIYISLFEAPLLAFNILSARHVEIPSPWCFTWLLKSRTQRS